MGVGTWVGAGKKARAAAGGGASDGDTPRSSREGAPVGRGRDGAACGRQFLRRYHHHVAFRRLTPPLTDTETVEMPVPLFPTCIDACGCMVAVGTREGPVILFDVGTAHGHECTAASKRSLGRETSPLAARSVARSNSSRSNRNSSSNNSSSSSSSGNGNSNSSRSTSNNSCGNSNSSNSDNRGTSSSSSNNGAKNRSCSLPSKAPWASEQKNKSGGVGGAGGTTTMTTAVSVYGSLADGTGPISAVLLDRAKVIAAGRGSRRIGGGYVIRIYAVDSTRLLRTLRCAGEVSLMRLFDPVLAVLSSAAGRVSFRDLYADGGGGLGQRTSLGFEAVAFASVEGDRLNPSANANASDGVILHCVKSNGTMFEASTLGSVWNTERDGDLAEEVVAGGGGGGGGGGSAAAVRGGWHVCADIEAALLIRASPSGHVSGWRLHPSGRRARGPIFCFRLDSSPYSAPPPAEAAGTAAAVAAAAVARPLTSMALAAGGLVLAVAREGAAPGLWDVRLARRARRPPLSSSGMVAAAGAASARRSFPSWEGGGGGGGGGSAGGVGGGVGGVGGGGGGGGGDGGGGTSGVSHPHPHLRVWGLASGRYPAEALEGGGRSQEGGGRGWEEGAGGGPAALRSPLWEGEGGGPRRVKVRPWPAGAWAVGVSVDLGGGRMVSACSDGRLRVTRLRSNNQVQGLRAAVLRGCLAKKPHASTALYSPPSARTSFS